METKQKLNLSSGNVQDIKYLYCVLDGFRRKAGSVEANSKTLDYFKRIINDYNEAKASKYGLSFKPREVNSVVVRHVVSELRYLGLLRKEDKYWKLSSDGEHIAILLEQKKSTELKKGFAKLMLDKFSVFEEFLKRVKTVSNGEGVPIPYITSDVFERYGGNPEIIARDYLSMINRNCSNLAQGSDKLYDALKESKVDLIETKTERIKKIQSTLEKFVVSQAFTPGIKGRRTYDFVRSRTTFLELTNYATMQIDDLPAELTYLICAFSPDSREAISLEYSAGKLYINNPSYEGIREAFKVSIARNYNSLKDEFGYARIARVRDLVARELKISDNLFDTYLKRLYKEEPHWISFTYSGAGDKITEKGLPIVFEKPMREFFTLLKINEER